MSEVLYRKYRPSLFAEVIGQEHVKKVLKNALKTGRVSHAYLFTGPRGVGKTTLARILAKAVNCQKQKDGEPCTSCKICKLVQSNHFLDLVEIDAASYTGVDNIREIIEHVKFTPSRGRYKVFIIDEVHMLSKAAFNALLKTLEEPPRHAIFVLATTEVHKVPATIISRTQRFDLRSGSPQQIGELFEKVLKDEKIKISAEALRLVASSAHGSMRDALSILDQLMSFSDGEITLEIVEDLLGVSRGEHHHELLQMVIENKQKEAGEFVRKLVHEGKDAVEFTRGFLEYLRMILLVKMNAVESTDLGLADSEREKLYSLAERVQAKELFEVVKEMMKVYREAKSVPVPELPLLTAVLYLTSEESVQEPKTAPTETKTEEASPTAKKSDQSIAAASVSEVDLGVVVDRWSEVLNKVKEYNHSLISSLRLGRLVETSASDLVIAFPYNFHRETVEARKNRIVIEQVLEDVLGAKLRVRSVLERDLTAQDKNEGKEGDLMSEAIKVLGVD